MLLFLVSAIHTYLILQNNRNDTVNFDKNYVRTDKSLELVGILLFNVTHIKLAEKRPYFETFESSKNYNGANAFNAFKQSICYVQLLKMCDSKIIMYIFLYHCSGC